MKPPLPKNVEEARFEAMGILLGIIDMARVMCPSDPRVTPRMALIVYADMVEQMVREHYGPEWNSFKNHARACSGAN